MWGFLRGNGVRVRFSGRCDHRSPFPFSEILLRTQVSNFPTPIFRHVLKALAPTFHAAEDFLGREVAFFFVCRGQVLVAIFAFAEALRFFVFLELFDETPVSASAVTFMPRALMTANRLLRVGFPFALNER